jgi:HSP20 family molecular chaperone IbpA
MSTATATHALPAVHAYETDDEVIVQVELPAGGRNVEVSVDESVLAVRVPRPHPKPHRRNNPDATPS